MLLCYLYAKIQATLSAKYNTITSNYIYSQNQAYEIAPQPDINNKKLKTFAAKALGAMTTERLDFKNL